MECSRTLPGLGITLSADALRTSGLTILGGGSGITPEALAEGTSMVWGWIKEGMLKAAIERVPFKDVERAWKRTDVQGRRIVITP